MDTEDGSHIEQYNFNFIDRECIIYSSDSLKHLGVLIKKKKDYLVDIIVSLHSTYTIACWTLSQEVLTILRNDQSCC